MTALTLRSVKGAPLTNSEMDANLSGLNTDKLEAGNNLSDITSAPTALTNLGLTAPAAELNFVAGVTSAIQTQLTGKAATGTTISAGTGLTGGGSLAANRTLSGVIQSEAIWAAGTATTEGVASPAKVAAAIAARATLVSGPTAPVSPTAFQMWQDTTSGTLKQRNAANDAWLPAALTQADQKVIADALYYQQALPISGVITAATPAATVVLDFAVSNRFSLTLNQSLTVDTPSNMPAIGQSIMIVLRQDATGGRAVAWAAPWKFPGGTAPTLSTAAGAIDVVVGEVVSATEILCNTLYGFG